uniref:Uncharacterized protein n=1 Tax=Oryza sativa subsp. japonica TaxID=39947 RepID=Q10PZ7_ORYSJ|nr:hypothetical protein LOC_Os03g11640 [Oryza sativa Japonica Group]
MRRSSNAQLADAEDMKGASQLKDTNFLNDEKGYKLSAELESSHRNLIRSIWFWTHQGGPYKAELGALDSTIIVILVEN